MLKPNCEQLVEIFISSRGLSQTFFFSFKNESQECDKPLSFYTGSPQAPILNYDSGLLYEAIHFELKLRSVSAGMAIYR